MNIACFYTYALRKHTIYNVQMYILGDIQLLTHKVCVRYIYRFFLIFGDAVVGYFRTIGRLSGALSLCRVSRFWLHSLGYVLKLIRALIILF